MTNSPAKVVVLCAVTAAATMSPRCSLACIQNLLHPSFSQRSQILPSSALQDILRTIAGGECTFDHSISSRMVTVYRIFKLTRTCCHRQKQAHVRSSIEVSRQIWAEDKPGECLNFLCGHFAADLCIRLFLRSNSVQPMMFRFKTPTSCTYEITKLPVSRLLRGQELMSDRILLNVALDMTPGRLARHWQSQ